MNGPRWLRASLLSVCVAFGGHSESSAQTAPADRVAYDAAFKEMIGDPGNLQKAFTFVERAIRVGDLEGAVAALERMLILAPNLPRVRLELGVLYYRLGSYQIARRYIAEVLALPDVPPTVRQRAEAFQEEIDRQINPHKFSGTLLFGFRYQSNANAAPTAGNVRFGGLDAQLDRQFTARKDGNAFVVGSFQHLWDFGLQGGEALDTQATIYAARQFKATDVDVLYTSVTSGPRMWLLPSQLPQVSVRPYVGIDYVMLGTSSEYLAPGVGVNLDKKWSDVAVGFVAEVRRRDYHNSKTRPFNDFRTGWEMFGRVSADWQVLPWLSLGAWAGAGRFDARKRFESYNEWLLGVGAQAMLGQPAWAPGEQISLTLSAARLWDNYDAPDPAIDPGTKRRDREWRLSLTLQIPIAERLAIVLQAARNSRSSSLPNFDYTNYIGMAGLTWRF